jgi:hypothetical protein
MSTCPVNGCGAPCLKDKLMCLKHWRQVPLSVQFNVYRCWATLRKCKAPNLRMAASRAYREAREQALKVFNEQAA